MTWEMVGRAATYFAALGVFGVLGLRWLIGRATITRVSGAGAALRGLGLSFAGALVIAGLLRALCQSLTVWGVAEGVTWEKLGIVAFESRWGGRWQWQPIAAAVIFLGFLGQRWLPKLGWLAATIGALGFAAVLPMTGHAYGNPTNWIAQSVHVLGFGVWLGTLSVVVIAPTRQFVATTPKEPMAIRSQWLERFAPLAAAGAITVLASGILLSLRSIPSWPGLVGSDYGRAYLVKLVLVASIAALGARNYRALRRNVGHSLGRAATLEAALALLVLVVTAILTSLPQPDMVH